MINGDISKRRMLIYVALVGMIAFFVGALLSSGDYYEYGADTGIEDSCNVLVLSANGYLTTYIPEGASEEWSDASSAEDIVDGIFSAQHDSNIKAVILSVDSGGGDGVAGEEVANALRELDKPSVAVIRGLGASSAYWASTGADRIYASKISDVGSIAITASYLDETKKIESEGYQYTELSSGRFKNLGDVGRPLTAEERAIVLSDLRKAHDVFVQAVADNRGLEKSVVEKLANGLTYVGTDALSYGLIDEIGDMNSAILYLEGLIGEEAELCWY